MCCPHCKSAASARTSKPLSPLYREVTYQCRNLRCGHVFVAGLEALRTLSPSALPDPDIDLPFARHIRTGEMANQLALALEEEQANEPA
jgi:hypothetical protein